MAIGENSTIILRTKDAIYAPCKIASMSNENITVTYVRIEKNQKTGKYRAVHHTETIPRKNVVRMSERL